jgi:hypothetical protein
MTHAPLMYVTALSPLIPAKAGTQGGQGDLFCLEASILFKPSNRSWIPAFAGMSGVGLVENVP